MHSFITRNLFFFLIYKTNKQSYAKSPSSPSPLKVANFFGLVVGRLGIWKPGERTKDLSTCSPITAQSIHVLLQFG